MLEVRIKNRSRKDLRSGCPQLPDLSEWEGNKEIAELELWRLHHMAQVCLLFLDSSNYQFLYERASDLYVKVISKEELVGNPAFVSSFVRDRWLLAKDVRVGTRPVAVCLLCSRAEWRCEMIVTQQEIEALLQRYRNLPDEVQERIEAMVEKMVAGLEREAEWAECARRLWRAIFTKIWEIAEAGGDGDANA